MMDIMEKLSDIQHQFSGRYALYAEHLKTGEKIQFGPVTEPMETASVLKVPVLVEALRQCHRGQLSLTQDHEYREEDFVEGSGILQNLSFGLRLSLHDVLTLMITVSDNIATNMALRIVGIDQVNSTCRDLGLKHTEVCRRIDFSLEGPLGLSTAQELVQLFKGIYAATALDSDSRTIAIDILEKQQYNTLLTRQMPYDLLTDNDEVPPKVVIASKSGSLTGIRNDAGLVMTPWGDYAIAVMSEGSSDHRFHVDTEAHVVLPQAARAVFDHFIPNPR